MKTRVVFLQKDDDFEEEIRDIMENLELEETDKLLASIREEEIFCEDSVIMDMKGRIADKLGIEKEAMGVKKVHKEIDKKHSLAKKYASKKMIRRKGYAIIAAAIILLFVVGISNGSIVQAFNKLYSMIPGVGILENNQDILYQLKSQISAENDQGTLKLLSATATKNEITVSFEFTRKNFSEEQQLKEKEEEWKSLESDGSSLKRSLVYLKVDSQTFQMESGSSCGGGASEFFSFTYKTGQDYTNVSKNYTLSFEKYDIKADFQLVTLKQYHDLNEIGTTEIHNNISLTATAVLKDNKLSVHVYPVNNSKFRLISFNQDYDQEYFGKKLTLITDKGEKAYTLPDSYGSGMNAAYTFDVSDGAKNYILSVPFVVVESKEEEKISLPIPKEGEIIELNKRIEFEDGCVMIKSVEWVKEDKGNPYGDLRVHLEYENTEDNMRLVSVELTRKKSEGCSMEVDDQNRIKTINYVLNKSDKNKLKLYVVKPRYVIMDRYKLELLVK